VPTQASILSHSSAPSTPQTGHIGKESENAAGEKVDTFGGKQCDPLQLPQRVPLLEEGKRQQNPSVLNQRFRDAALMGQLAVFLFLWLFFAVFLTHGRKQASNPAPLGRIWNTLVYLLAGTASAVELKVGLFLLIIVALLLPLRPVSAFFHPCVRAGPGESGAP